MFLACCVLEGGEYPLTAQGVRKSAYKTHFNPTQEHIAMNEHTIIAVLIAANLCFIVAVYDLVREVRYYRRKEVQRRIDLIQASIDLEHALKDDDEPEYVDLDLYDHVQAGSSTLTMDEQYEEVARRG